MNPNEDPEVRRRAFLSVTIVSVGGLLVDRLPPTQKSLLADDGQPLTQLRAAITGLYYLDGRDGAASVLMPAGWLAGRLTGELGAMQPEHDEYLAFAGITAEANRLAGWVAFENGEYGAALRWYGQAIKAAEMALDPDFAAFAAEGRARVLSLGLGNGEAALRDLDRIELGPLSPRLRAVVHEGRARALAAAGKETTCLGALDQATGTASEDGPAWIGWQGTPAHVEVGRGLALADLGGGHAEKAYSLLNATLRRLPAARRRVSGTSHRGLAQAAMSMGEPVQAAAHVLKAHEVFTATQSRQLIVIKAISRSLEDRYGDVAEVRDLREQLRAETRYVTTRSMRGWRRSTSARARR